MDEEKPKQEENYSTPEKVVQNEETIATYEFFSNPVKVAITLYNGLGKIIAKLSEIEDRLSKMENQNAKAS